MCSMVLVTKIDGTKEPYDPRKLNSSLKRAGVPHDIRDKILRFVERRVLYDGITTQEIYEAAFDKLRRIKNPFAARYSLKRAILDLGPSGFPFERFMAGVFRNIGYRKVRTGVAMQGKCAPHEVDLVAHYRGKRVAAELKFHNALGVKTDLKDALYVKARFDDLNSLVDEPWLITNTRFTRNAIRYGQCAKLNMMGWDYPYNNGIETLIDKAGVHPITALTTISESQKRKLLDADIVLCKEIKGNPQILRHVGIFKNTDKILEEIDGLCGKNIDGL